jgi:hypothetical protein
VPHTEEVLEMILEKLKAGTRNSREIPFHGMRLKARLLSEAEIQQSQVDAHAYATLKRLTDEGKAVESILRQLFMSVTDHDGNKLAENMDCFRDLLTRVDREYLVEEYLYLEAESMPTNPGMEPIEFNEILAQVKKSPDSILNASNISTLRRLVRYLESQP